MAIENDLITMGNMEIPESEFRSRSSGVLKCGKHKIWKTRRLTSKIWKRRSPTYWQREIWETVIKKYIIYVNINKRTNFLVIALKMPWKYRFI